MSNNHLTKILSTMVHKKAIEMMHGMPNDLRPNERLFGGALILFSG